MEIRIKYQNNTENKEKNLFNWKIKVNERKIKSKSKIYLLLYFYIIIFLIHSIECRYLSKLNKFSEIKLTIKGNGNQTILSNNKRKTINKETYQFTSKPSEIFVNGNKVDYSDYKVYNLTEEENIITIRWNYQLTSCAGMFNYLDNITKIEFFNFDTSKVTNLVCMFCFCSSLTSVDISNFNTSLVTSMETMFIKCSSLEYLNFGNLDTSSVTTLYGMFNGCILLKSIDLSSFNTSLVNTMNGMFFQCESLESLNIQNFDISSVTDMYAMFFSCIKLKTLNLNSFNASSPINLRCLFYNCTSLISLDINNFGTISALNMEGMFYNCINLTSLNLSYFDTSSVTSMISMFYNCKSLISLDLSNFDTSSVTSMLGMFSNCKSLASLDLSNFDTSSVNNMGNMFKNCESLKLLDLSNFNFSSITTTISNFFDGSNDNLIFCMINENNITDNFLNQIQLNNYTYQNNCSYLCHMKSKKYIIENNKCIYNCYDDNIYKFEYKNYCYKSCPNGTHLANDSTFLCEKDDTITTDSIFKDIEFFNSLYEENNLTRFQIIENVKKELVNKSLDFLITKYIEDGKKDLIYFKNDIIYQITSVNNQNNNNYNNISRIIFGECEKKLKKHYNISDNIEIIILKIDIIEKGLLIPIIEYELYNSKTKEKLNLEICKDEKIKIYIPVSLDENNLFKYNSSSKYYNDICFSYTTEYKTDITLKDRREEYLKNNMSVCENICEYNKYDYDIKTVECECFVKINFFNKDILINKDKLLKDFKNIKNIININVIKCYKVLFTKEGLINNIGSYILLSIIFLQIILIIIFRIKGLKLFQKRIDEIIKYFKEKKMFKNKNILIDTNNKKNQKNKKNKGKIKKFKRKSEIIINSDIEIFKKEKIEIKENYQSLNDYELNNLIYKEAIKKDKRSYIQYYSSLLRMKQLIIFTFYTNTDYNSKLIKISLFFFSFAFYYTINALFFNEEALHHIYENKGAFNFIYQIPQIFYSSIISSFINIVIKYLSLSEKNISEFKEKTKSKYNININTNELLQCIIIKFNFYFLFCNIFLLIFWYYLSCFCIIYKNTQAHLIKDTLISFGVAQLYPFLIYLIPGIFRIPSLKMEKKCGLYLYEISKIIQLI